MALPYARQARVDDYGPCSERPGVARAAKHEAANNEVVIACPAAGRVQAIPGCGFLVLGDVLFALLVSHYTRLSRPRRALQRSASNHDFPRDDTRSWRGPTRPKRGGVKSPRETSGRKARLRFKVVADYIEKSLFHSDLQLERSDMIRAAVVPACPWSFIRSPSPKTIRI